MTSSTFVFFVLSSSAGASWSVLLDLRTKHLLKACVFIASCRQKFALRVFWDCKSMESHFSWVYEFLFPHLDWSIFLNFFRAWLLRSQFWTNLGSLKAILEGQIGIWGNLNHSWSYRIQLTMKFQMPEKSLIFEETPSSIHSKKTWEVFSIWMKWHLLAMYIIYLSTFSIWITTNTLSIDRRSVWTKDGLLRVKILNWISADRDSRRVWGRRTWVDWVKKWEIHTLKVYGDLFLPQ